MWLCSGSTKAPKIIGASLLSRPTISLPKEILKQLENVYQTRKLKNSRNFSLSFSFGNYLQSVRLSTKYWYLKIIPLFGYWKPFRIDNTKW